MEEQKSDIVCPLCGHNIFIPGPGNRKTSDGLNPQCQKCGSLERHRIFRQIFNSLVTDEMKNYKILQFSEDNTIDNNVYKNYELSLYARKNSIDIQNINRPDSSYDIIICNHILEHVKDDGKAISELSRIVSKNGFVFLSVPAPLIVEKTRDWGFPDESRHGHYRIYGADFIEGIHRIIPYNMKVQTIYGVDPVTNVKDVVFILRRD